MENNNKIDKKIFETFETNEQKEEYIVNLSEKMLETNDLSSLFSLITSLPVVWDSLTTARLTKIIKNILSTIEANTTSAFDNIHAFLLDLIEWSSEKKMLKLDLECRLINLYLTAGKYRECLEKISTVLKELKKYDDKINLITLYVYESRAYYELQDFEKAKSSLTSARALAVSSACPAQLQAQIDLLNGMYLSDEHSFDTSVSYFMEALEGFLQDKYIENARVTLRYIILNKILCFRFDDIATILLSKHVLPLKNDPCVQLLCTIAKVCKKRDLNSYKELLSNNTPILEGSAYITRHLMYLYNILLDKNILKIIEPYSHVKVKFIAEKLEIDEEIIEDKLRKMILDKTICGILDHDTQCLVLYDSKEEEEKDALNDVNLLKKYFSLIK
ncbi:26S proteasome regulatory subunit rpn6 [Glugoides intestinalis]